MLKMMGGSPGGHEHHARPEPESRPQTGGRQHRDAMGANYGKLVSFSPRPLP